jgi:polyphosphate kinase 2 (PPK2 family)
MKMKINLKDFRVREGEKVKLKKWPTLVKPVCESKKQYQKLLGEQVEELSSLQQLHYASNRDAVLLIFQAMDAAGKDGAIRHVMSGVNPQGCQVFSFKHVQRNWSTIFCGAAPSVCPNAAAPRSSSTYSTGQKWLTPSAAQNANRNCI